MWDRGRTVGTKWWNNQQRTWDRGRKTDREQRAWPWLEAVSGGHGPFSKLSDSWPGRDIYMSTNPVKLNSHKTHSRYLNAEVILFKSENSLIDSHVYQE